MSDGLINVKLGLMPDPRMKRVRKGCTDQRWAEVDPKELDCL